MLVPGGATALVIERRRRVGQRARRRPAVGPARTCRNRRTRTQRGLMPARGVQQAGERPLEELVQTASQEAVAEAREQVDTARRELAARAMRAAPGAAMLGGGALLAALASGTGTASLILLLSRRPGASAAALGVTGAYAGAAALLAREGLARLNDAGLPVPDPAVQEESDPDDEQNRGSAKRRAQAATKAPQRIKSAAKSPPKPARPKKPVAKSPSPRGRAPRAATNRRRGS